MKAHVTVTVIEGPRQVTVNALVEAGSAYGQHPVVGAMEKALTLAPKIIAEAIK